MRIRSLRVVAGAFDLIGVDSGNCSVDKESGWGLFVDICDSVISGYNRGVLRFSGISKGIRRIGVLRRLRISIVAIAVGTKFCRILPALYNT
jgi:hypothetical protein